MRRCQVRAPPPCQSIHTTNPNPSAAANAISSHAAPTPRCAIDLQGRDTSILRAVSTAHGSGGVPAASSSVPSGTAAGSGQSILSPVRPASMSSRSCEMVLLFKLDGRLDGVTPRIGSQLAAHCRVPAAAVACPHSFISPGCGRQPSQLHPTRRTYCGTLSTGLGATPMRHSGFAYPSLLLSAFVAVVLAALPAQAQAPRPGQLAPGPGQVPPPGPRGQPAQSQPPGQPAQSQPPGQPGQAAQQQARQPAPPKPYKPIPVTLAQPYNDASFTAF